MGIKVCPERNRHGEPPSFCIKNQTCLKPTRPRRVTPSGTWYEPAFTRSQLLAGRMKSTSHDPPPSVLRAFLTSEASGGLMLMATAAAALVIANSPLAPAYFGVLKTYVGGLSILHWINDALMAVFFLLVGLE